LKNLLLLLIAGLLPAQSAVKIFVSVDAPLIALTHARVIDGSEAPPQDDQTVIISNGLIQSVGTALTIPAGAKILDLQGQTVLPGLVRLHDHLL